MSRGRMGQQCQIRVEEDFDSVLTSDTSRILGLEGLEGLEGLRGLLIRHRRTRY